MGKSQWPFAQQEKGLMVCALAFMGSCATGCAGLAIT